MEKTWTITYLDGTSIEVEAESFAKAAEQAKDMLFYADLHARGGLELCVLGRGKGTAETSLTLTKQSRAKSPA